MTCLACDCDVISLHKDWALKTFKNEAPILGHLPCKGNDYENYFPWSRVDYHSNKFTCAECYLEVPKEVFDKACFISKTFKDQVEQDKQIRETQIAYMVRDAAKRMQPSRIIYGDDIESQFRQLKANQIKKSSLNEFNF